MHSRAKSIRPQSKTSKKSVSTNQFHAARKSLHSPERIARQQYKQAKEYEQKMQTRVQYLAKEEEKFMRKIEKTRDDAMRLQGIKQSKINDL